jgi:hypothetical protein
MAAVSGDRCSGGPRHPVRFEPLAQLPVVVGVAPRYRIRLTAFDEFFDGVCPRRLEQAVVRGGVIALGRDERLGDQLRNTVDDLRRSDLGARRDCACRRQAKAAGEDREATQHHALGFGEQLVAPIERRPQRLVPRQRRAVPVGQHVKTVIEP